MSVRFVPKTIQGRTGLDLQLESADATVQDLLTAVQPWCDDDRIHKQYLPGAYGSCAGCAVNCCRQCFVVPDLISFHRLARATGRTAEQFTAECFDPDLLTQGLPRLKSGPCLFWRESDGLCTVYASRTLICRLYLCTPLTDSASQVVYGVVQAGMGAFVRWARQHKLIPRSAQTPAGGYAGMLARAIEQAADWEGNPFHGAAGYEDVELRSFIE